MVGLAGFAPATRDRFSRCQAWLNPSNVVCLLVLLFWGKNMLLFFFFVVIFCEVGKIMENNKARDEHAYLSVMQRFTDNRFLL